MMGGGVEDHTIISESPFEGLMGLLNHHPRRESRGAAYIHSLQGNVGYPYPISRIASSYHYHQPIVVNWGSISRIRLALMIILPYGFRIPITMAVAQY